jgi:hypothetical protein
MEITFLFRVRDEKCFGKIQLRYYSDDHNGLDEVIRPYVEKALNTPDVYISILGTSTEHTTERDRLLFDLYINCMDHAERHHWYSYLGKLRYLYRDDEYTE